MPGISCNSEDPDDEFGIVGDEAILNSSRINKAIGNTCLADNAKLQRYYSASVTLGRLPGSILRAEMRRSRLSGWLS